MPETFLESGQSMIFHFCQVFKSILDRWVSQLVRFLIEGYLRKKVVLILIHQVRHIVLKILIKS